MRILFVSPVASIHTARWIAQLQGTGWDLHLLQNAPAVDQGSADQAPALDADLIPRPQGGGIDLGAYDDPEDDLSESGGLSGFNLAEFNPYTEVSFTSGKASITGGELQG